MSNLTAAQWSELILTKLRGLERECADEDLFCVGYLIPLVELLEVQRECDSAELDVWNQWYKSFVEHCLQTDKVQTNDVDRIGTVFLSLNI